MRCAIALVMLLASCEDNVQHEVFDRNEECHAVETGFERTVSRQGACIVHAKIGSSFVCTAYSHYSVTQHRRAVICGHDEWIDGAAVVQP